MIVGLFLLLYIAPLGLRPIVVPDETRYAEIPREMIESGDWIVPHLNGVRYFEKPVLGYWATAASMTLFGENAFAVRLPSALAAGLSSLLLFSLLRTSAGHDSVAGLAAVIFLTCLGVFGIGTFCALDSLLSFFITGAMATFFRAHTEDDRRKRKWILGLCGISCGFGFLTKGFVAFAVPVIAIIPFLLWECQLRVFARICWIPILTAALVALPWAILIHTREPDFWRCFFWHEHIKRFIGDNAQHAAPLWYYVLLLPAAAMPWTFLTPAAVAGSRQPDSDSALSRFSLCWFVFPLLFFSASRGKLFTYILPCFAPIAVLMAIGLHRYSKGVRRHAFIMGALLYGTVLSIGAGVLVVSEIVDHGELALYSDTWRPSLAILGMCSGIVLVILSCRTPTWGRRIALYVAASLPLGVALPLLLPDRVVEHKVPEELLRRNARKIQSSTVLVADADVVHAVCWYYKRRDVFLFPDGGELDYGLGYSDARHRILDQAQFRKAILKHQGSNRVALIAKAKNYRHWRPHLREPLFEDSSGDGGFVFLQY